MARLPEGIRRVCIVAGVVLNIVFLVMSDFDLDEWMGRTPSVLAVRFAFLAFLFLVPFLACLVFYWVKDGFTKESSR